MANNPPPEPQFYPHKKQKKPKSYDLIVQLILAGMASLALFGIAIEKGCSDEKPVEEHYEQN